jgi:hypothetical protein
MTPATVHHGHAETVHEARSTVLAAAYAANPDRFVNQPPRPPIAAGINKSPAQELRRTFKPQARTEPERLRGGSRLSTAGLLRTCRSV